MGYLEYYLARELIKLGQEVYIFTFNLSKRDLRIIHKEGFKVIYIPYFIILNGYHLPSLSGINFIINFIKLEKPEIIHCEPLYSPLSLIFLACKRVFHFKIVGSILTQLNLPWSKIKKILFSISKIIIEIYAEKISETIFVKSRELEKIILNIYNVPINKLRIIPLGADSEIFKFDPKSREILRNKLGMSKNDVVIVYSGKINPSKDLDVLIIALAPIIIQNNKVKLLIVGKGNLSYVEYLEKLALNLMISNNIIFHPWVHRTKLPGYYSASDIAVWPGLSSGSIVEAASVGLPIIIAKYPVEIFAIEYDNGFIFEPGNVNELREYLQNLIYDEKLRKEMGQRSRLLVEQKLNWKAITIQYLKAYNLALKKL